MKLSNKLATQSGKFPYRLSIIIPVHDLEEYLPNLFDQLRPIDADSQFIFIDDNSNDNTLPLLRQFCSSKDNAVLLENEHNLGAGSCRNLGFKEASGQYTLFFDGDDILHLDELLGALDAMDENGSDLCISTYNFIRKDMQEYSGMNLIDLQLWDRFYKDDLSTSDIFEVAPLLAFTNYPWNKVIRTHSFIKFKKEPLFGETSVNNDILGHWRLLLNANRISLFKQAMVTHIVLDDPRNLSNRFGLERLDLFIALEELYDEISRNPKMHRRVSHIYWEFSERIIKWAEVRVNDDVKRDFLFARTAFFEKLSLTDCRLVAKYGSSSNMRWILNGV